MRVIISLAAAVAACTLAAQAAAKPAAFDIKNTSWHFTDKDGTKVVESVDAGGNYIANSSAGKHLDHGTAVMRGGKACFTSAMNKDGEVCWTTPVHAMAIGHTFLTKSDKGEKLHVTRVKYAALKIPD